MQVGNPELTRQKGMKAWEILLSESQERMLIVCKKGREKELLDVFEKWDLECAMIGETVKGGRIVFKQAGETVADVPARPLVLGGGAPVYKRKSKRPTYFKKIEKFALGNIAQPKDLRAAAKKLWKSFYMSCVSPLFLLHQRRGISVQDESEDSDNASSPHQAQAGNRLQQKQDFPTTRIRLRSEWNSALRL